MRGGLGSNFITNTHKNNRMKVALAPGDGLLLEKVCYDKYNKLPQTAEPIHIRFIKGEQEVDAFRNKMIGYIASRELNDHSFTSWTSWFDDNCLEHFVDYSPKTTE